MIKQSYKLSAGVTLLEMMVALLVLSIGLLGVATLQVRGQQFNQVAYFRTQATFLAYDLMERIRTNSTGAYAGDLDASDCPAEAECDGNSASCSSSTLVNYDRFQWCTNLGNGLPGGSATIDLNGSAYTITIKWKNVVPDRPTEERIWILQL